MTLRFRLGKIPVRIMPWFFVTTVFINIGLAEGDARKLVLWLAIVLASVLLHEMGHALAVLAFGLEPRIDLHSFGGTTSWAGGKSLSPVKHIVVSLAGPAMGFIGCGLVVALHSVRVFPDTDLGAFVYGSLVQVNFGWGVLNLLPMMPLDGGGVMSHALDIATKGHGERPARIVSLVVSGIAALAGLVFYQSWWTALLAVMFFGTNWRALKDLRAREHDAPMRAALEQAYAALDAKDGARILAAARPVALESKTAPVRAEALQLLAFGFLLERRLADADAAIAALPPGFAPHPSLLDLRASVASTPPT